MSIPFLGLVLLLLTTGIAFGYLYRLTRIPGSAGILEPLACFVMPFLLINVLQPLSYWETLRHWHSDIVLVTTLSYVVIALTFVGVGYYLPTGKKLAGAVPSVGTEVNAQRLLVISMLYIAIGIAGWFFQFVTAGGLDVWSATARGGTSREEITGYTVFLADLVFIGITIGLVTCEIRPRRTLMRRLFWCLALILVIWYVYIGSRYRTLAIIYVMAAAYFVSRRSHPGLWPIMFIPILAVLSNLLTEVRHAFRDFNFYLEEIDFATALSSSLLLLTTEDALRWVTPSMDFNVVLTVVDLVPDVTDYAYGYPFLEVFTRGIPRTIWDGKIYPMLEAFYPVFSIGGLTSTPVEYSNQPLLMGPAVPFVGYWYLNGGLLGIAVGSVLTGIVLRGISEIKSLSSLSQELRVTLFVVLAFGVGFSEGAATPITWMFTVPLYLIAIYVAFAIASRREKGFSPGRANPTRAYGP